MTDKLPPNLLALFAPRPPLRWVAPPDHAPESRRTLPVSGVAEFLPALQHYKETDDYKPTESWLQMRDRKKLEKQAAVERLKTEGPKNFKPHEDPNIRGDAFKTLIVARLSYEANEQDLEREFGRFGPIERIRIITDTHAHEKPRKKKKPHRGYAFVVFEREKDMRDACDGIRIKDRRIKVDVERGRTVKGWVPRRFGGGLGGRGYTKALPARPMGGGPVGNFGGGFRGGFRGGFEGGRGRGGFRGGFGGRGGFRGGGDFAPGAAIAALMATAHPEMPHQDPVAASEATVVTGATAASPAVGMTVEVAAHLTTDLAAAAAVAVAAATVMEAASATVVIGSATAVEELEATWNRSDPEEKVGIAVTAATEKTGIADATETGTTTDLATMTVGNVATKAAATRTLGSCVVTDETHNVLRSRNVLNVCSTRLKLIFSLRIFRTRPGQTTKCVNNILQTVIGGAGKVRGKGLRAY
ncbi:U1 small nuclear ribonucleoprotein [Colletotrichum tofieldiae]|nr:U1 small nuclear ribonucleoprotein [Colletotrichum tofieldiae]